MKKTFFAKYAMLILLVVCFLTPLILRGARDALRDMKNNVKDWLPSRFKETAEMEWFWQHFHGERFIIVTWPGCTGSETDQAFHLFKKKLVPTLPPSKQNLKFPAPPMKDVGSTWLERPYSFIGDRLGLYAVKNDHFNWGSKGEKWLRGFEGKWYYITEAGDLYEFNGSDAPVAILGRAIRNSLGLYTLTGTHQYSFGEVDGPWYYADPSRLQAQLFKAVVTGPDVLRDLTKEGGHLENDPDGAMKRLTGALFGPDRQQTALICTMTDAGLKDFHRVLGRGVLGKEKGQLYQIAEECGIAMNDLHLGGPPVDNVAIDEEGSVTLLRLVTACVILGLTLSYICFRSVLATLAVFMTGGISAAMGLCFVGWTPNVSADAIMMSMPALVYVLGISGSVHLINYYREAVDDHGLIGAPERAIKHAWMPALLSNVTTAVGLLTLYTSEIIPIRNFGIFSAAGVMATLILMFTFLPAALQLWPLNLPKVRKREDGAESALDAFLATYWERLGSWIIQRHWQVATGCVLFIAAVGFGVTRINTSVNLLELFDPGAKIISDYAWIEDHLGMLVPMEVVVKFDPKTMRKSDSQKDENESPAPEDRYRLSFLDRMETVAAIQSEIDEHFGERGAEVVGRTMSATTFAPQLPGPSANFTMRRAVNAGLEDARDEFLKSDYLRIEQDHESELWRISLRVAAFKGVDYGEFVIDLRNMVEPVVAAQNARQEMLRRWVEQRATQTDSSKSNVFRVGMVVPDPLYEMLKTRDAKEKEASKKKTAKEKKLELEALAKAEAAKAAAAKTDAKRPEIPLPLAPIRVTESDHDSIFARTLKNGLKSSNATIAVRPVSFFQKEAKEKLSQFDSLITVGEMPASIVQLAKQNSKPCYSAQQFLAVDDDESKPAHASRPAGDARLINAIYTGVVPIVYKAQRTLLDSLISSTFWSFMIITPLMMIVARNVWAGLVAMLPNALPVLVIFGFMGWSNIRVDIGSMMTASIALGVAVDDTIHYLTWFREELDRHGDRKKAILAAYKRCATPTTQAAVISGLGLSIFAMSTFTPTQRFGLLMLSILFAGVVSELIFYPALLAGPLGSVFKPRKRDEAGELVEETASQAPLEPPATVPLEAAKSRPSTAKRIASIMMQFWGIFR